jgi:hypothetical protein
MTNRSRTARPSALCLAHPIHVTSPVSAPDAQSGTRAMVECERRGEAMSVTHCQQCERFDRVEVREGAYVLLCDSVSEHA